MPAPAAQSAPEASAGEIAATIRILMVEDSAADAELELQHLRRAGLQVVCERVQTEEQMRRALSSFRPGLILSDLDLPQFDGAVALQIARQLAPQVPFLYVSGKLGEEGAIDAMHRGAADYVLKSNLTRLAPAVMRAIEEAGLRQRQDAQIARLNRVLRMLSGVNGAMLRIRDRAELLRETCRLAVSVGGYSGVVACAKIAGSPTIQPVAWHAVEEGLAEALRRICARSVGEPDTLIGRAIHAGRMLLCNDAATRQAAGSLFNYLMTRAGLQSMVALPILVDGTPIGVLLLAARDAKISGDEELHMLQEVAGNLSFAWQYMQKDTTVRFLSHFDPRTGLAKRALFCDRLNSLLSDAIAARARYAVTVFDIERLGLLNDSFGRRTGDLLLQHVAARLKSRFPNTEHIAHFGGGTFAMIEETTGHSGAELSGAAQAHAAALVTEPFIIEEREIPLSVRSGVAVYPQDGKSGESLVQNAESALLHARSSGVRQLQFSAQRHSERVGRLALEHKLRLALERGEFRLCYQPKVNVITRRIEGVEALIRWHDPEEGMISPAAFLPVVESSGLGPAVGAWVIEQAAHDCQQWMAAGLPPIRIAVNVSPSQLLEPDFTARFLKLVEPWSTFVWGLDVEVTEGAFHEDAAAEVQKLKLLRKAGVRIAIDDFGTGYSSLGRLSSLPVDTLKIDSRFISQVPADASGRTVVKTIVALARGLNMTTVAEGVENQEQLDFLWQIGCDQSQGYLHSRPIAADEFVTLLQHGSGHLILAPEPADTMEIALPAG
jgi:diguanylate cyclase (GGDEF)-like protein